MKRSTYCLTLLAAAVVASGLQVQPAHAAQASATLGPALAGLGAVLQEGPRDAGAKPVGDEELAGVTGRHVGNLMLVGLRIDLVSSVVTPTGNAQAQGTLLIVAGPQGPRVQVHTDARVTPSGDPMPAVPPGRASGAEQVSGEGIVQVAQIAGDGNHLSNLSVVRFDAPGAVQSPNGARSSQAGQGGWQAQVRFDGPSAGLVVSAPGVRLVQQIGGSPQVLQSGVINGHGIVGSNRMQLQMIGQTMPVLEQHRSGIHQALLGLAPLGR